MEENTINYSNLSNFALIRFGHQIGHGWYKILAKAEKELYKLGYSIELVERREGILCISRTKKIVSYLLKFKMFYTKLKLLVR